MRIYPWANGAAEGLRFCYQLMYLLNSSPFYTPVLRLLQQHIVRVSGQELVRFWGLRAGSPPPAIQLLSGVVVSKGGDDLICCSGHDGICLLQVEAERAKSIRRRGQLQRAEAGLWLTSLLRQGLLKAGYAFADHSRNALILAVFAFKVRTIYSRFWSSLYAPTAPRCLH